MIVKIVPTLRYAKDGVQFDAQYFETRTVSHRAIWVSSEDRTKHLAKLDNAVGDYWIQCAREKADKDNPSLTPYCESVLIVDSASVDEPGQRVIYITGAHAIYLMNDEGKTIDTLIS